MPTLYIVATPIGNLKDITLRAVEIFKGVDFIICEDTRVSKKLFDHYAVQKPLLSYFQHSRLSRMEEICDRLSRGESAALVTDAGTPGISDPGGKLIKYLREELSELVIVPIPGACAAISALSISGFPTDSFLFLGFPPHKKGRQTFWKRVAEHEETVVLYESTHRIIKALGELKNLLDENRQLVVCRELTKLYESIYRGTISQVCQQVTQAPQKGEYVIVVEGKK